SADHCGKLGNAEMLSQLRLGFDPVFHGHEGKSGAIGMVCRWIEACRAGGAMAAAQIVDTDNKEFIRINGLSWPHHVVPPSGALGFIRVNTRNMMISRERVTHQQSI